MPLLSPDDQAYMQELRQFKQTLPDKFLDFFGNAEKEKNANSLWQMLDF